MDCIDIQWGPDGKAWVVEMTDYPLGMAPAGHIGPPVPLGTPGGRVRVPGRHGRRRPLRQVDGVSGTGRVSQRRDALAQGRDHHRRARDVLRRGQRRGRAGRYPPHAVLRLPRRQPAAPRQSSPLGPGQLGPPGQRRQRRRDPLGQDRRGGEHRRPRPAGASRRRTAGSADGSDPVRPQPERLGRLVRLQQLELRAITTRWPTTTCAAIRTWRPRPAGST